MSSSETAAGVRTPRSVKSKEMYSASNKFGTICQAISVLLALSQNEALGDCMHMRSHNSRSNNE